MDKYCAFYNRLKQEWIVQFSIAEPHMMPAQFIYTLNGQIAVNFWQQKGNLIMLLEISSNTQLDPKISNKRKLTFYLDMLSCFIINVPSMYRLTDTIKVQFPLSSVGL